MGILKIIIFDIVYISDGKTITTVNAITTVNHI